ncbi:MAG: sulfatase [Acidobacteria bacterium]|nr:sulfatase [Acidobacteriota bacterium]
MTRRNFLAGLAAGAAIAQPARVPNVVIFVSDDHGYGDASCYENHAPDVQTPNIDRIAAMGVRYTQGYASCYVCAPTRAGLMTGRYQQRYGFYTASDSRAGLPLSEVTLADLLRKKGYATAIFGKWHLGLEKPYHPLRRGFDHFYGFLGHGAHDYFALKASDGHNAIYRDDQTIDDTGYLTDNLAREATAFIERNRTKPFFLYLPFNAVHAPLQAPEADIARYHSKPPSRNTYLAMLYRMDLAIGRVLDALEQHQLTASTLICFQSDNGGSKANSASNGILRGFKQSVYEGGIRVPFLAAWPGRIPRGKVSHEPVICMDIFATACEAAQVSLPTDRVYDGRSLLGKGPLHDVLLWDADEKRIAVREGDWKLIDNEGKLELFHLGDDVSEKNNLAAQHPDKVKQLQARFAAWRAQMKPRIRQKA